MTDRQIKLTTKMPEGDANGLADPDVIRRIFDDPTQMRVGIVIFNAPKYDGDDAAEIETRKAQIVRIEAILDDTKGDASALQRLLMRAYERRTGATTLDAELEEDVRTAFDGINIIDLEAEETFPDRDDQD
jgi:hypothetical protein